MEATDARRAFPSFDEPSYKATFAISLMVDNGDTVISNGALISDTPGPETGKHTLTFAPTLKMSTYLVAMLVGDFACRSGGADGVPIRICATPDKLPLTGFALEASEQQLAFFNEYFGIQYPFGKLDIVAVPDFAAGAMENTGAITFRERLLLVDEERASLGVRKTVAGVLAHEIAHQWFGNLVTMKWWDDIWLNEGFATWLANKPLAVWRPEWNVHLDEAEETQAALALDALQSTRPIRLEVETPEEINQVFDAIAYEKTASVLRMIEAFVGADAFREGVSSYLTKFSFGNAAGEDFWSELTRVTGRPVDRILGTFVDRPGAPVVSIRTACTGTSTNITLRQERFVATPGTRAPASEPWTLPVCFKADGGQSRCEVLEQRQRTVTAPACESVFANAEARGYYFTEYSPEHVRALARTALGLTPAERLSLLGDEWWMVRGGRHDIGVYLDLAGSLADDGTSAVTEAIAGRLSLTGQYFAAAGQQPAFRAWIRRRFGPALDALGLAGRRGDNDEHHSRRAALIELVGVTGNDPIVQRRTRDLAVRYIADPAALPGTLVPRVLQVGAVLGDVALYERYLAQLEKLSGQPEEYYRYFNALVWFSDPALVRRTLQFAMTPSVRTQDTGTLIAMLLARPWGRDAAWEFTKTQWPALMRRLGTFQGIPMIVGALGNFCSAERAADVRQFFASNPVPSAERALQQSIERIETCAAVAARQSPAVAAWLPIAR